jgi:hypothetical protein
MNRPIVAVLSAALFWSAVPLLAEETHSSSRFTLPQPTLFQPILSPLSRLSSAEDQEASIVTPQTRPLPRPGVDQQASSPPTLEPGQETLPSGVPALSVEQRDALLEAAIAAAVAKIVNDTPPQPASSERLNTAERQVIATTVAACWNVGSMSADAKETSVTVAFELNLDGSLVQDSIRLLVAEGGNERAAQEAFEAARRAILRCGAQGFSLPQEKYEQWARIEMNFIPIK